MFGSKMIPVYCYMGKAGNKTGCGDGGWTLAMKINGTKVHFFSVSQCLFSLFSNIFTINLMLHVWRGDL